MYLEADLHTHTIASGHAYSTLKEMAEAAAQKGLKMLGSTDHGVRMPGGPHEMHFDNLVAVPRFVAGVEVLRGVEANIIDTNGTIDMPEGVLHKLDLVLAGFHDGCGYVSGSVEENTRAMVAALHNPFVHVIVHPGNPNYPVDIEKVVLAAKACGKAFEINNSSFSVSRAGSKERCLQFAHMARRHQTLVVINSDSHFYTTVGEFSDALEVARKAGLNEEQILNASADRVRVYLTRLRTRMQGVCLNLGQTG